MKFAIFALGLLMASFAFAQTTAEEWFKGKDTNEDGYLVLTEVPGTRTEGNFASYDTNGDDKLSFAEYKAGREATEGPGPQGGGMGPPPAN